MKRARWDLTGYRMHRDAHMRRARRAASFVAETAGETQRIWREHMRQHVKAARREHWLLVAQSRAMSASMFLRKTIGAHGGAVIH